MFNCWVQCSVMSVRFSWFIVLLQLVFELSKNGTILNVAITGLGILTGPLHCCFGLEHSSHR